eukprot:CAMPEP_0116555022 /NCGR_PEP_ID=MMETSP0397-20121206/7911_1 /TAXON_ID=216820 /ORGANISM="Cyclophora tenuis, Strain ECT3854" /LENGTH=78 /DNA_ID=CAMNT_0004080237 /DNA_START=147 /DNA_END=383 /DNA_ORIENTATION=+
MDKYAIRAASLWYRRARSKGSPRSRVRMELCMAVAKAKIKGVRAACPETETLGTATEYMVAATIHAKNGRIMSISAHV